MAAKPKLCDICGEMVPKAVDWPAVINLGSKRCEACDKLLCPACVLVDLAGTVYCVECVEIIDAEVSQVCRICGCTVFAACQGGCSWVHGSGEAPLCSACAAAAQKGS